MIRISRASDSRIPSSPRSWRAMLFVVTPAASASRACDQPSRFRIDLNSLAFMYTLGTQGVSACQSVFCRIHHDSLKNSSVTITP
jgi:hypothetical protein